MPIEFVSTLVEWRGPAPYIFAPLPGSMCDELKMRAAGLSYGWGVIPVSARIGETSFTTSLFPHAGGYLLPIKNAVQRAEDIGVGSTVFVQLAVTYQGR